MQENSVLPSDAISYKIDSVSSSRMRVSWTIKKDAVGRGLSCAEESVVSNLMVTDPSARSVEGPRQKKVPRNVLVKGFRNGKVPRDILWRRYGKEIQQAYLQKLLPGLWESIFASGTHPFIPVDRPQFSAPLYPQHDHDLQVVVEVDVLPQLGLTRERYVGLRISAPPRVEITEEMVSAWMEERRHYWVTFRQAPPGQRAASGDYLLIRWHERDLGALDWGQSLQLGLYLHDENGGRAPGFDDALVGVVMGESGRIFQVEGSSGPVEIEILGVDDHKLRSLPTLEDVAASEQVANIEALRRRTREQMEAKAEEEYRMVLRLVLMARIVGIPELSLPQRMLEEKYRAVEQNSRLRAMKAGRNFPDSPEHRAALQQLTLQVLWTEIALEEIARMEKLQVSTEEIEEELVRLSRQDGEPIEDIRERIEKTGLTQHIKKNLLHGKTFKWLLEHNTVIEEIII